MKTRSLLIALLMSMLLACLPGTALAMGQPVIAGFAEGQEQHVTVNESIDVSNVTNAICVIAHAPETAEDKTASAIVKGDVTFHSEDSASAVYVEGRNGDATAEVNGSVSATSPHSVNGIETWGHSYNGNGKAIFKSTSYVSAQSSSLNSTGIDSECGIVDVGGDVSAKAIGIAIGVESWFDESIKIGGSVSAESENASGVFAYTDTETNIDVTGGISATGKTATGLDLKSGNGGNNQEGKLSVTVGNGITATSTNSDENSYAPSRAVAFLNTGKSLLADINGKIVAQSPHGNAVGIATDHEDGESGSPFSQGKSEILVHGNVISDGIGVGLDTFGEDTDVNILVEKEIQAKNAGVLVNRSRFAQEDSNTEPKLTVWKIQINERGNVAETGGNPETDVNVANNFEKHIMYITKVEQPGEGGILKAVDKDGNDLLTSYDFPIAHEGEKVILKADLKPGWEIKAAYNGRGADKQKLSQDENDNYYLYVPKGGGIYLSADLEKEAAPAKTVSGTLLAKMTAKGSKRFTFGWTKVNGADGYDVFLASCNSKETKNSCKKVKTIKGNKTFKWTKKGLKKGKAYKAYVKAWIMKDGKKTYVKSSPLVHAYTNGGNKLFTNAKSVTVKKTKVTLAKDRTYKIKAAVSKLNPKKKLMPKGHAAKLRYLSSNTKIATVSKAGKIKAKAKGSCKIYVYAVNGISKTVTVRVK